MKILVKFGDNSNKEYSRKEVVDIDPVEYLVYKDDMNYCSSDTYDGAWEHIIRAISQQVDNLPDDWYVDKIEEFWGVNMKILDSFTFYYDKSEKDKLTDDEKYLRTQGWNTEVNDYLFNDELEGYYMLVFTEIDGFVPENLAERIRRYIFEY